MLTGGQGEGNGKGEQKEPSDEKASNGASKERDCMTRLAPSPLSLSVAGKSSRSGHAVLLATELRELLNRPDIQCRSVSTSFCIQARHC